MPSSSRVIKLCISLCLLLCLSLNVSCADEPEQSTRRVTLLKTFIDELVSITPGQDDFPASFEMGSTSNPEEQPVHRVTLNATFHMARYEVPQNLYEAVMGSNPSRWKGPRNSAERMTWNDAQDFCKQLTDLLQENELIDADEIIRLPSEAEWEYCCRAGATTAYSFGDKATSPTDIGAKASLLDPFAWHTGNAAGNDPAVGVLKPNAWGLYDMHGYLWEFTSDRWQDTYDAASTDGSPQANVAEEAQIVIRGGSWKDPHPRLRSAARQPYNVDAVDDAVGFRCVRAKAP